MHVILASGSKYRKALLEQTGLPFTVRSPEVDEAPLKKQGLPPKTVAHQLAALKGEWVRRHEPTALIIASDQVAHHRGEILSKPGTRERAFEVLSRLQDDTHELITALWMSHPTLGAKSETVTAQIRLRPLSADQINAYLDFDQPYDCAGSYKWERAGISLIKECVCSDSSSIIGLPLIALNQILSDWKLPPTFAWAREKK